MHGRIERPNLYALAFVFALCGAVLAAAYLHRPPCSCVIGGADYFDDSTIAREDCALHGAEKE